MPQPRRRPAANRGAQAAATSQAVAPTVGGAAGAAGLAAGAGAAAKVLSSTLAAIRAVIRRLSAMRLRRLRDLMFARGMSESAVEEALRLEVGYEREFRERSEARVEKAVRLALEAQDVSVIAAAIQAALRREEVFARQRAEAQAARVLGAMEFDALRAASPSGAYWQLGRTEQHCPRCLALAGRFWPWEVLERLRIPLHYGCDCRLRSLGDALAAGILRPEAIVSRAQAIRDAEPIIVEHERIRGEEAERRALRELSIREELLECGADPVMLAALPLAVDELIEAEVHSGAMVAFYPTPEVAERLALPKGEAAAELHLTVAFLGKAVGRKAQERALAVVRAWAKGAPPLKGVVSGVGYFVGGPKPVTYASVDLPGLPAERERLVSALERAGVNVAHDHGFTPHITLDYANRRPKITEPIPLEFDRIVLAWGGERTSVILEGKAEEAEGELLEYDPRQPRWPEGHPFGGRFRGTLGDGFASAREAFEWDRTDTRYSIPDEAVDPGWRGSLTDAEADSLRWYTGKSAAKRINRRIREGGVESLPEDEREHVKRIDAAIRRANPLEKARTLWRGVLLDEYPPPFGGFVAYDERERRTRELVAQDTQRRFSPGDVISLGGPEPDRSGFGSATTDVSPALDASVNEQTVGVVFEILTDERGARLEADLTEHDDEAEVLLARDGQYVVLEVIPRVSFEYESRTGDTATTERTVVRIARR